MPTNQRRKSRRIPVHLRAEYILLPTKKTTLHFHAGLLLDISRGGALLAVKEQLTLDCKLFLIFNVNLSPSPGEKTVSTGITGRVIREHSLPAKKAGEWEYHYGLAFDKPFAVLNS